MRKTMSTLLLLILCVSWSWAQQTDGNSLLGHPQMILHNGKIVSMDDDSFEARVGTITQAMAVRDGKILATGSNDVIRALAGPETQSIDLKGRTVLPSLILTHEHPTDWMFQEPRAITHVLPNDDMVIHRWLPSIPPKQQLALFDTVMQEALAKAKPGQWVLLSFNWGLNYEWAIEMGALFRDSIKKEYLDQLAPNNPVKVKNGFITSVVNQKALDKGIENLKKHIENIHLFGLPVVVAINTFATDREEETQLIQDKCGYLSVPVIRAEHWAHGGAGTAVRGPSAC